MIIEIRAKNCYAFNEQITFSMKADMRNKKFASNVHKEQNFNVLKTAGIYGPNNSGKTCLIRCINDIKSVLLNIDNKLLSNFLNDNDICELGITFLFEGRMFSYDFKYSVYRKEYLYESFKEIIKDQYGNEKNETWLIRDSISGKNQCNDDNIERMMSVMANNNIMIYLLDTKQFELLDEMKRLLVSFAEKIDVIDMNTVSMKHTIDLMKNNDDRRKKVVEFIKNADLYLENYEYVEMDKIPFDFTGSKDSSDKNLMNLLGENIDTLRLVSTYKGIPVPSILFDSKGTAKMASIASYVIDALEDGRILVIDELDSSLHFKLTRAIVSMFNNELNNDSQLIFTVHDINLMDCKRLFRKEQIWFVDKDDNGVYVYSLADFTAEDGVRDTSDIIEKYRRGAFAALPEPELINTLLSIKENN